MSQDLHAKVQVRNLYFPVSRSGSQVSLPVLDCGSFQIETNWQPGIGIPVTQLWIWDVIFWCRHLVLWSWLLGPPSLFNRFGHMLYFHFHSILVKDPLEGYVLSEETRPKEQRDNSLPMQVARGLFTQVPGAAKYLRGLACRTKGQSSFYRAWGAEARYRSRTIVTGRWLVGLSEARVNWGQASSFQKERPWPLFWDRGIVFRPCLNMCGKIFCLPSGPSGHPQISYFYRDWAVLWLTSVSVLFHPCLFWA